MNTPDDEPGDELTRAYRNTSDTQAGRPGAATRAAILAEARATALRRTPAANDSRYVWRAAAGIAVLGVAVLLWRQTDRKLSPDLTVANAERPAAESQAMTVESKTTAPPASAEIASRSEVTADADVVPAAPQANTDKVAMAPSARMEQEAVSAAAPEARERADAPASASGALRRAAPDPQLLLQREFADVWNDVVAPRTAWLVTDAEGKAVRKGVASGADTPPPGDWTYFEVKTASGRSMQLAVMQLD